jgi:hypothetical protein
MTQRQAETVANLLIGAAVVGAAIHVLRTPALRRTVWGLARNALTAAGPAWVAAEARRGWADGADSRRPPGI